MVFKCKICGGSLDVKQGEKITICEYCGVRQSIPSFIEPKTEEIYNRANNYLMHNEFDKAENLYNQILFDDNSNADAYWNVLMCRYGVSYVKDPASGKYIPTCNRTLYTPIFNDENYKKALQYADEAQKELYISDAKTIDDIQKQILSVSKHEKPFDIFISYKETETSGMRTQDSIVAQDLYNKLTAEGYKVFFSRITLEDKAGTEYEPYIYAALASSKVMITISSSKENIEAVWVKNEWSRYLSFARKDAEKTLIPLYFNMGSSELPEEFAHLTAYDMSVNGFEQELIRGIKKLIPLPVMLLEQRKRRNKVLKKVGIGAIACAVVGLICAIPWFMKMPDYNAAMQLYYDKNYPEATWAFDELGSYRDSVRMKEKSELSWRKSLASVVTDNYLGGASSYYAITENGTVETDYEQESDEFRLTENGKIVSIADNENLYALRENGFVENVAQNKGLENTEWLNAIKISPVLDAYTNIALNSNGKMMYGNVGWAENLGKWNNIITFETYNNVQEAGAMVIGLKNDGTLCAVVDDALNMYLSGDYDGILNKFTDIERFDFSVKGYNTTYEKALNIVALKDDGTIIYYLDGVFREVRCEDAVDVNLVYDFHPDGSDGFRVHYLDKNGNIKELDEGHIVLKDIVYIDDDYYITRSGSIFTAYYSADKIETEKLNVKSCVYGEWIERLN